MPDEDSMSEDALSRADSRTDSRSDLAHVGPDVTESAIHSSSPKLPSDHNKSELVYDQPWGASKIGLPSSTPSPKVHNFTMKSFTTPFKCHHCTSLLIGVIRQGTICTGNNSTHSRIC